ncbi:MAG: hypothetical protein ACT4OM_03200 [Actinomycetota bacterium]
MKAKKIGAAMGAASIVAAMLMPQAALATEKRTKAPERRLAYATAQVKTHFGGPGDLADCPAGSTLMPFDKPIYDNKGLFVIGYETVWFCIPDDLEPAG